MKSIRDQGGPNAIVLRCPGGAKIDQFRGQCGIARFISRPSRAFPRVESLHWVRHDQKWDGLYGASQSDNRSVVFPRAGERDAARKRRIIGGELDQQDIGLGISRDEAS